MEYIINAKDPLATELDLMECTRIVRCKDCTHYTDGMCAYPDGDGGYLLIEKDPDGFCDWGRKE